jgi:NIMA (never in mitosis gene a)-related kinase
VLKSLGKFEGYAYESEKNSDGDGDSSVFGPIASREYLEASTATMNELILTERSILYLLKSFGNNFSLDPIQLPSTCKIRDTSISDSHFLVVTEEGNVFGWGDGQKGQLCQNIETTWKHFPSKIETLQRYNVVSACAGDGYSLFLTNYGIVLSCGTSNFGCLGIKGVTSLLTPKVIQKFDEIKIIQIACHKNHALALDVFGNIFAFGHNEHGALGLGSRTTSMTPQRISSASSIRNIKKIYCAPDCSLILTHDGIVFACGSNNFNRFGFGNVEHVNEFVSMCHPFVL